MKPTLLLLLLSFIIACKAHCDEANNCFKRGIERMRGGDAEGAMIELNRAIELEPKFLQAYRNRAFLKRIKCDFDGAIADLTRAIEISSGEAAFYNNRGTAKGEKGDFDDGIADLTKAIEIARSRYSACGMYSGRGNIKQLKGDLDGAVADCNKAIEIDPNFSPAYNNRGWTQFQKNDFDGAIKDATRALELDPNNAFAFGTRGWARYAKADLAGAIEDLKKAIDLFDAKPLEACRLDAALDRGMINYISGDFQKAIDLWQKAIQEKASLEGELKPWIEKAKASITKAK